MVLLYGGAIECTLPAGLVDASQFRDVPSHQEVWVSGTPDAAERSVIIELNEMAPQADAEAAARFHFADLVEASEAVLVEGCELRVQPLANGKFIVAAMLLAPKFNEAKPRSVAAAMAMLRFAEHGTDCLVTQYTEITTSSQQQTHLEETVDAVRSMAASFAVRDPSLFA